MTGKLPHDAFQAYLSLGDDRSYQAVAEKFGVSKRAVTKCAGREDWQGRLLRIEQEARERSDLRAVESIEAMNERHLKMLRAIQHKALTALHEMPLTSAMDAVRSIDISLKQERTLRGEPTDRTAVSVEQTIKAEYSRWLSREDEGDEPEELTDDRNDIEDAPAESSGSVR